MKIYVKNLALCSLLLVGCSSAPPNVETGNDKTADIYILPSATYRAEFDISENAKVECGLEKSVVNHFAKFAKDHKFTVAGRDSASDKKDLVTIEIVQLVAGRAGSGFGGRWVVSEMKVAVELNGKSTYEACSAGLGVNMFANLKACDRLERCSEQLGNKVAKWVASEVK